MKKCWEVVQNSQYILVYFIFRFWEWEVNFFSSLLFHLQMTIYSNFIIYLLKFQNFVDFQNTWLILYAFSRVHRMQNYQPKWTHWLIFSLFLIFILFYFLFFYCSGFCHTLKWISHGFTCVPHPDPPSHLKWKIVYKYVFYSEALSLKVKISIVNVECCVSFRCSVKWFSYV